MKLNNYNIVFICKSIANTMAHEQLNLVYEHLGFLSVRSSPKETQLPLSMIILVNTHLGSPKYKTPSQLQSSQNVVKSSSHDKLRLNLSWRILSQAIQKRLLFSTKLFPTTTTSEIVKRSILLFSRSGIIETEFFKHNKVV